MTEPTQAHIGWATSIAQHLCAPADREAAIRLVADAFRRFEQERTEALITALEPFAHLQVPAKPEGNAGFYSILFKHIRAADEVLARFKGGVE